MPFRLGYNYGSILDCETKQLEFTAERTVLRANEKKALDSAQIEREKVGHKSTRV